MRMINTRIFQKLVSPDLEKMPTWIKKLHPGAGFLQANK